MRVSAEKWRMETLHGVTFVQPGSAAASTPTEVEMMLEAVAVPEEGSAG